MASEGCAVGEGGTPSAMDRRYRPKRLTSKMASSTGISQSITHTHTHIDNLMGGEEQNHLQGAGKHTLLGSMQIILMHLFITISCSPLCSKKAVQDVQSQGRVCVLDIDMQVCTVHAWQCFPK